MTFIAVNVLQVSSILRNTYLQLSAVCLIREKKVLISQEFIPEVFIQGTKLFTKRVQLSGHLCLSLIDILTRQPSILDVPLLWSKWCLILATVFLETVFVIDSKRYLSKCSMNQTIIRMVFKMHFLRYKTIWYVSQLGKNWKKILIYLSGEQ